MSKCIGYIRVSSDTQDSKNQHHEILTYAHKQGLVINDFIEISISSKKTDKERRIDELRERLQAGDILLVTELSRLGRSTGDVITLINKLIEKNVRVIALKHGLDISKHNISSKIHVAMLSLFAEIERDFISRRTTEALAARKSQGIKLGKPLGTIQKSKFDLEEAKIRELLALGLSVRKIAKFFGYSNHIGLNNYITKRKLRESSNVVSLGSKKADQRAGTVQSLAA